MGVTVEALAVDAALEATSAQTRRWQRARARTQQALSAWGGYQTGNV